MIASSRGQRLLRVSAAISVVAVAAVVIVDHVRLIHLTRTSPNYASRSDMRTLQRQLDSVDAVLTRAQHAPATVSQATFDATRQAFDAQISNLEQLATAAATTDTVNALDTRVHQLEARQATAALAASKATTTQHRRAAARMPLVPPFAVLGEEQRGGQTFLVVAPPHWQALDDVHLLQPGDSEDNWQLEALDGDTATFRVDGHVQRLPVR